MLFNYAGKCVSIWQHLMRNQQGCRLPQSHTELQLLLSIQNCLHLCPKTATQNQNKIYKNEQSRNCKRLFFAPDVTTGILESYLIKLKISLLNFNEYTKTEYTKRFIYNNNNNISIKLSSLCVLKIQIEQNTIGSVKVGFSL